MVDVLEIVLTSIGFICILLYVLYLDYETNKLRKENRELRHKIQTERLK